MIYDNYITPLPRAQYISFLAGSLIAAGVSALFNAVSQYKTNRSSQEFQREMMDKQNDYNSYESTAQRMKDAGLNPAFMFGNGATEGNASIPSSPSLTAPTIESSSPAELFLKSKQVENETVKTEAETDKLLSESQTLKTALSTLDERNRAEIDKIKSDKSRNEQDITESLQRIEESKAKASELLKNAELIGQRTNESTINQKWISAQIERNKLLAPIEARELMSRYRLNEQQAWVASQTITKVKQETANLLKQGKQLDAVTMSQVLENAVKEVQAVNKIEEAELRQDSPVLNAIYDNCNGFSGDIVKILSSYSLGISSSSNSHQGKKSAQDRLNKSVNTWMFSK